MNRQIKTVVNTGWANCDHTQTEELPDNWDEWSEKEQDEFLNEIAVEFLHNCCEAAAWVEESE